MTDVDAAQSDRARLRSLAIRAMRDRGLDPEFPRDALAQVASVGGYPIEYQIDVDPVKLRAYGITLGELYSAVERSNSAVGGRVVHLGNGQGGQTQTGVEFLAPSPGFWQIDFPPEDWVVPEN